MKNAVIALLTTAFATASVPSAVYAVSDESVTVKLRIEGPDACYYYGEVTYDESVGSVMADTFLRHADEVCNQFELSWTDSDYGSYISGINGLNEGGMLGGYEGWQYRVNNQEAAVGLSECELVDGDEVVIYYCDPFTYGMQYPEFVYDVVSGNMLVVSYDTVYDDLTWEAVSSWRPVPDAYVTWYDGEKSVELKTDDRGMVTIPEDMRSVGEHAVEISRYVDVDGVDFPTVLRVAPDTVIEIADFDNVYSVTVVIQGINNDWANATWNIPFKGDTLTMTEVFQYIDKYSYNLELEGVDGGYITSVNGDEAGHFGGGDGWFYRLNGEVLNEGVPVCEIPDNARIELYYADPFGAGFQFPEPYYNAYEDKLIFTSNDIMYDDLGNPYEQVNPVADLTVELYGKDGTLFKAVTDENGVIDLSSSDLAYGEYEFWFSRYSENKIPTVLRNDGAVNDVIDYGYVLGDLNNDGSINAIDASLVLTAYANSATGNSSGLSETETLAADTDLNSTINALDASLILSYYAYAATGGQLSFRQYNF